MSIDRNFMGLDGFVWFIGVVEDRQDPLALGRVRVRVYGFHSASLSEIPTEDLPWASVLQNSSLFSTPKEADVVVGFFADGRNAQTPVIMGILPGFNTNAPSTGQGFNDLRPLSVLKISPKKPLSRTYNTDGSGIIVKEINTNSNTSLEDLRYPQPDQIQEQSITGVSRYEVANTAIEARKQNLDKNIVTADGLKWSEPYPAYNAQYPYDKVIDTESGHIIEIDDTPGAERISHIHRTGTFSEMYPSGSKVEKVTKSNYQIIMGDDHIHIMGRALITIDQESYVKILGDVKMEFGNDVEIKVSGDLNLIVKEDLNIKAGRLNIDVEEDVEIITGGSQFLTAQDDINIKSSDSVLIAGSEAKLEVSESVIAEGSGGAKIEVSDSFLASGGSASLEVSGVMVKAGPTTMGNTSTSTPTSPINASEGSAAQIEEASERSTAKTGRPTDEEVPIPLNVGDITKNLDAYTGNAIAKARFRDDQGDGTTAEPQEANTTPMLCNFDPTTKEFIIKKDWIVSQSCLNLIKKQEGYAKKLSGGRAQAYPDPATGGQPYTIGYGTTGAVVDVEITLDTIIDKVTAEMWLLDALNDIFLPKLKDTVRVMLTQNQIDSCLSLMYNIGTGNWSTSTVKNKINEMGWCEAGDAFLLWKKADGKVNQGLVNRRTEERALFLT